VISPTGEEIDFKNPKDSCGGYLEADRNLYGESTAPLENIFWPGNTAPRGTYRVYVQNYAANEKDPHTPFQVEIKNGKEYLYFEGTLRDAGRSSLTNVCTFEYAGNDTLDRVRQLVNFRKQRGIFLYALELGENLDAEFLRTLIGPERTMVPIAEDLNMELEFGPGIAILEVLGDRRHMENGRILWNIGSLHCGDYETLLVRYRIPVRSQGIQLAAIHLSARNRDDDVFKRVVILTDPLNDPAARMLRFSGAVYDFAGAIRDIGGLYYGKNDPARMTSALHLARETKRRLEAVREGFQYGADFDRELALITRYVEILSGRTAAVVSNAQS
jgi:Ca-activated chloride channel family protein